MTLTEKLVDCFKNTDSFTLKEAYNTIPDKPATTIRARIYENIGTKFERIAKGIYKAASSGTECIVLEADGRDLSCIEDESIEAIITDHPWSDKKSNKGGNRSFADYDCFEYNQKDFEEKARVLKPGCFLVEMLPEENANNYEYLYKIKQYAKQAGLQYYAKVAWKKQGFVANTGRKSHNIEDVLIFSKGKPRALRPDAKKTKATGEECLMSGTAGMLPALFEIPPVDKKSRLHQAEKPLELMKQIICYVTKVGETVLDSFAGSGVVGHACLKLNRNCILIEKMHENIEKIQQRLKNITANYPLPIEAKIFLPTLDEIIIKE